MNVKNILKDMKDWEIKIKIMGNIEYNGEIISYELIISKKKKQK